MALALDFEGLKEVRGQVEKSKILCLNQYFLVSPLCCAQPGRESGRLFQLLNTDLWAVVFVGNRTRLGTRFLLPNNCGCSQFMQVEMHQLCL